MPESESPSIQKPISIFCIAFVAMLCVSFAWTLTRGGCSLDDPPTPWNVDGIFYDNVAFNLNQGNGFSVDLYEEDWRSTYLAANEQPQLKGKYDWLLPVKGTGATALRSPGYPYVLAATYQFFGRRYDIARILGCVFVSIGLALLLTFCALRWSWGTALIAATTMAIDYSVMQSAGTLATESLAILIFAITFLLVVKAWEQPTHTRWFAAGLSFAALMLTRGIWSLGWLILVAVAVACLLPIIRKRWETFRLGHLVVFLVTAMIVALPWWTRNCMTTDHFTPFGTAGSCGFVGGYCDQSLANYGQWQPDVYNQNQIEVQKNFDMDVVELAHLEHAIGEASVSKTKAWCLENWARLPKLMVFRCLSHWGMFNPSVPRLAQAANLWLVFVGLTGCFFFTGNLRRVFICVLLLDMILVMLTWEHLGRYAIPIRPIVHIGYGLAISSVFQFLIEKVKTPKSKAGL